MSVTVTELSTGTHSVTSTEWSLAADSAGPTAQTTNCAMQAFLDLNDMVAGDQLQIRVYEKCRSGDTQRVIYEAIITGTMAATWVSPALLLKNGWDVTCKQLAGTSGITVLWSLRTP